MASLAEHTLVSKLPLMRTRLLPLATWASTAASTASSKISTSRLSLNSYLFAKRKARKRPIRATKMPQEFRTARKKRRKTHKKKANNLRLNLWLAKQAPIPQPLGNLKFRKLMELASVLCLCMARAMQHCLQVSKQSSYCKALQEF